MNESAELSAAAADARTIPSLRDTDESWRRCCRRLRAELGENVFTSWFGRLKLDSIRRADAQFSVPTRFLKSWIETHYSDRILAALEAEIGGVASVAIWVALVDGRVGRAACGDSRPATAEGDRARRGKRRRASLRARRRGRSRCARRPPSMASRSPVRRSIVG